MMRSRIARLAFIGSFALFACTVAPTGLCGCTPSRSAVLVGGVVLDAASQPVAGARVYLDGVPRSTNGQSVPYYLDYSTSALTDGAGSFRAVAYSLSSPGQQELRAAVVRPSSTDTVRLVVGLTNFRTQSETPDSIYATLRLP